MDLLFFLDRLCRETVIKNAAKQNISKKVFINFIPTSIYDPQKCLKSTDEALTKYKLDPKNIVFEVVETDYIEDYPHLNNILSYYKGKGYSTALDDIGSGYSDINALLALNPKYMKIDMNLIKNIDTKPKKQEKVVNYIKVAKENNIIALAEGIERKEEADVLIEIFFYLIKVSKCEVFMNKKYEVLEKLEKIFEKESHVNAKLLGDFLKIDRSTASRYLNDLVKEGYLEKILTRPVQYKPALDKSIGFEENIKSNEKSVAVDIKISKLKENSFKSLIGENDSLLQAVQKAKAAILYPPNGLHTLILGETGAGKSYFAEKMHEYAIASKVKPSNAPFVTLNCADYSDNPQLLLAQIFGSKKGSYTGAEKDKEGLLKVSNGGILFLDEVHRLSHQGQEMLFTYMDNGIYRELGSVSNVEGVKVQIIAATTEEHMFCESKRKEY